MSAIIERLEPTERQLASILGRTSPLVEARDRARLADRPRPDDQAPAAGLHHDRRARRRQRDRRDLAARSSSPASRHCGSPPWASACSTPCSRAPTRTRRCRWRSCSGRSTSPGRPSPPGPGSRRGSSRSRRSGWCSARRPTRRGSWTRWSSRRASRSGSPTARSPPTRRSRGCTTSSRRCARRGGSAASAGRGTRGLLVGLLVLAIRHGDRLALAMDARAFGSGPRSRYRVVRWSWLDLAVSIGAFVVLVIALRLG